jgi:hypothetical protein
MAGIYGNPAVLIGGIRITTWLQDAQRFGNLFTAATRRGSRATS